MPGLDYKGGGLLEPTEEEIDEFIPNPQQLEIRQLEGDTTE